MNHALTGRRLLIAASFVMIAAGVVLAGHYRILSWHDWKVYRAMRQECHPVWADFHFGRIQAGQDVEEVIARTRPAQVERFGEFVLLTYQDRAGGIPMTGVTATAVRGRMTTAAAWSCMWHRVFFDTLTDQERQAYWKDYDTFRRTNRKLEY
jgi:hypothetical protein